MCCSSHSVRFAFGVTFYLGLYIYRLLRFASPARHTMSRPQQASSPVAGTATGSTADTSLRPVDLKYHAVPAELLAKLTLRRLAEAGVPTPAMGRLRDKRVTLTGSIMLSSHARETLPPALGGHAEVFDVSLQTSLFLERAVAQSPQRGASLGLPPARDASPWHTPPRGGGGGGGGAGSDGPLVPSPDTRPLLHAMQRSADQAAACDAAAARAGEAVRMAELTRTALRRRSSRLEARATAGRLATLAEATPATGAPAAAAGAGGAAAEPLDAAEADLPSAYVVSASGGDAEPAAFSTAGLGAALADADDGPPPGPEALAAADRDVEAALGSQSALRLAAREARAQLSGLESVYSSVLGGSSPRPPARPSVSTEQRDMLAAAQNQTHASACMSRLTAHTSAFPLIARALRRAGAGGGVEPALLADFGILVLQPAAYAAEVQVHGLEMLRRGARNAASLAGDVGASAARDFEESTFDYIASEAIAAGAVDVDVCPLDLALGVLPLAQLGFHLWLARHAYRPGASSGLLASAQALHFGDARGVLCPEIALQGGFRAAWAAALSVDDEIPCADVYYALVQVLNRDALLTGGWLVHIDIAGHSTSWSAFARARATEWRDVFSGGYDGSARRQPSLENLTDLVRCLDRFGREAALAVIPDDGLRPPSSGGGSHRVAVARGIGAADRPDDASALARVEAVVARLEAKLAPSGRRRRGPPSQKHPVPPPPAGAAVPPAPPVGATVPLVVSPGVPLACPGVRVATMVVASTGNVLCITPLLRAGWDIGLTARAAGSAFTVPGVADPVRLRADAAGNHYLDLVPFRDGFTPFLPSDAGHRAARKVTFLVDSGAEMTLVGPDSISLLVDLGSVPACAVVGFNGVGQLPLQTGILVIYPPAGGTSGPPCSLPLHPFGVGYTSLHVRRAQRAPGAFASPDEGCLDTQAELRAQLLQATLLARTCTTTRGPDDPPPWDSLCEDLAQEAVARRGCEFSPRPFKAFEDSVDAVASRYAQVGHALRDVAVAVRRLRASAFPPVRQPHHLAERFNCLNASSLAALVSACPLGIATDVLASVPDDMDFSQGYAAGLMKAPPVHAARHEISQRIRDATPPGHVWWTDVSNQRPPDFDGNSYSRVFADERTQGAVTFYSARKDAATLTLHLDMLRAWIQQHVPGGGLSVLRCDFASEAVRQSHGDDIYTAALTA